MANGIFQTLDEPVAAISLMFAITQILGLVAGILLINGAILDQNVNYLNISPSGNSGDVANAGFMMLYVIFGAALALLIVKFIRTKMVFRTMEFAIVAGSVSILFFSFIFYFSSLDFFASIMAALLLGCAFAIFKFFFGRLKNLAAILSSAGVAALFGFSLGFWPALIFVCALALYDYLAVFKTKHMLVLAQGLGTKDMSFTITAQTPQYSQKENEKMRIGHNAKNANEKMYGASHLQNAKANPAPISKQEGEISRLDLGSGDLSIPAMLAVSSYGVAGLAGSLAVIIGSVISIYLTLKFVVKKQIVLPALPPICLGGLLGLLFITLIRLAGIPV